MVGNKPRTCDLCGVSVKHGNMKRHLERQHRQRPQPEAHLAPESSRSLELAVKLSEVFIYYGVPRELWPADRETIDRIRNYRLLGHESTAFDLPGEVKPQVILDGDQAEALPSFGELVIRLAARVGAKSTRNTTLCGDSAVSTITAWLEMTVR
jgi:hypothetical protein